MKLQVNSLWSTDLNLPQGDSAFTCPGFKVGIQVSIGDGTNPGGEVFSLVVCSPNMVPDIGPGSDGTNTLVLDYFDWQAILERIEIELQRCNPCPNWATAINELGGIMHHEVAETV